MDAIYKTKFSEVLEQIKAVERIYKSEHLNMWSWNKQYGQIENKKRQVIPSFLAGNNNAGYHRIHLPANNSQTATLTKIYLVTDRTCSCPDFMYRCRGPNKTKRHCKHIEVIKRRKEFETGFSNKFGNIDVAKLVTSYM